MNTHTFPPCISLTVTNRCNLRCRMCGQWSERGYMHSRADSAGELDVADWRRVVDELAEHRITSVMMRGGEPFLYPGIRELITCIHDKGMFLSVDTNGTLLAKHASWLAELAHLHLTISMDGPPAMHDEVRGVAGCFAAVQRGVGRLQEAQAHTGRGPSLSLCFTISPWSYKGLSALPATARSLGIGSITIVPYYFVPQAVGESYAKILADTFHCRAFSWKGFSHETSGIDIAVFREQYKAFQAASGDIFVYPYMPLTGEQYATWFTDAVTPVEDTACSNVERLLDIQPQGDVNFCVDFPDYTIGNIKEATLAELWNSPAAAAFRAYRRRQPLPVCHRCGAKHMGDVRA